MPEINVRVTVELSPDTMNFLTALVRTDGKGKEVSRYTGPATGVAPTEAASGEAASTPPKRKRRTKAEMAADAAQNELVRSTPDLAEKVAAAAEVPPEEDKPASPEHLKGMREACRKFIAARGGSDVAVPLLQAILKGKMGVDQSDQLTTVVQVAEFVALVLEGANGD